MCDRCGTVFSENDEGWSTDSRTVNRVRDDGKRYQVSMQVDQCGPCVGNGAPVTPRMPGHEAIPAAVPTLGEQIKAAEQDDQAATIRILQLQVADLQDQAKRPVAVVPGYVTPGTATGMIPDVTVTTMGTGVAS